MRYYSFKRPTPLTRAHGLFLAIGGVVMRTTPIRFCQVRMSAMTRRTKATILATVCVLALSACGYQGSYRYPCQDPENWDSKECNPPICKVDGACSKDLIGFDPDEKDNS